MAALVMAHGAAVSGKPKVVEVSRYGRVAILVCRVSDERSRIADIRPETDYGLRVHSKKASLYLDDEARLEAAFPAYPLRMTLRTPKMEQHFFGNLTAPLTELLATVLTEKGREVVDVRELSASWPEPFSEMTLRDIVKALAGRADALVVMHYLDSGDSVFDSVTVRRVDKGLSGLATTLALFDVTTGDRIAQVDTAFNPMAVFANDPATQQDPELGPMIETVDPAPKDFTFGRGFQITERQGLFRSSSTATLLHLDDEQLRAVALRYLRSGFAGEPQILQFSGLDSLLR